MISDGKGTYLRKDFAGKYSPVRNETLGDTWEQRSKAKNVLDNQLNSDEWQSMKLLLDYIIKTQLE